MNSIIEFLDLEDANINITDISISETTKTITLETNPVPHYCPICGCRMYSKGIKNREIQHPILQDNYNVVLILKQRRWKCTSGLCNYSSNEEFRFVDKRRRSTNATDILIGQTFRGFSLSAVSIAEKFHTTDTHVMEVFNRYVSMSRLPLSDIISVDEVCLDMDPHCKYGLVIQDFHTGDPIDLLISRRVEVTEPFFVSIPIEERAKVKYLISDMYDPYIAYVDKYFPNAVSVVDAFHVIKWMITKIDNYIRSLIKDFKSRDRAIFLEKHPNGPDPNDSVPVSDEVYLLSKYRWLILSNQCNIKYHADPRIDRHFRRLMNTYDYEDALYRISKRLFTLRELKELYITFNTVYAGKPDQARPALDELINRYLTSGDSIFIELAATLKKHKDSIINSFVMAKKFGKGKLYDTRLSNGPIESINRSIKDMKRNGRGYRNFEHLRNRFLYGTRHNPEIQLSSKPNLGFASIDSEDDFSFFMAEQKENTDEI